jgi:hypothetical protein
VALGTGAAPKGNRRAERFVMQRPLVYRRNDGLIWYDGKIENVSTSGLLFRGEKPLSPGEVLQVSFSLPAAQGADEPTQVFCWAKVVRIRLPNNFQATHTHAVKILRYRSQPQTPADIRDRIGEVRGPISMVPKQHPDRSDSWEEKRAA